MPGLRRRQGKFPARIILAKINGAVRRSQPLEFFTEVRTDISMAGKEQTASREKTIVKTAVVGIITNILLASFKALVGFASHSTALVLDAVNNTTDAISSIVTIVGTKLCAACGANNWKLRLWVSGSELCALGQGAGDSQVC